MQSPDPRPDEVADVAAELCAFVDAAPSPYHAVHRVSEMLTGAGFVEFNERSAWDSYSADGELPDPARGYVIREGSLVAWSWPTDSPPAPHAPFRVLAAHTDSPNLRIKPRPDCSRGGWDQLGVEEYGGTLRNSWLDRDLGVSGRATVRCATGVEQRLLRVDEPLLRVAQLAVHLDRGINSDGLTLNPQTQLTPIWGAGAHPPAFRDYLAELVGSAPQDVLGWDVMTHDLTPSRRLGHAGDLIAAPRLDNLCSAFAATQALIGATGLASSAPSGADQQQVSVIVLFDHEEIGSLTNRGGQSQFLPAVLERLVLTRGGSRQDLLRALAATLIVSADMAHAVHPNYPERYEPDHLVRVNHGPTLKVNSQGRYATDAVGAALFRLACEQAGVAVQEFLSRADMPCGSTIGPMTAALTGAATVDVGVPMLSMHSARELCGAYDPVAYLAALTAVLAPRPG